MTSLLALLSVLAIALLGLLGLLAYYRWRGGWRRSLRLEAGALPDWVLLDGEGGLPRWAAGRRGCGYAYVRDGAMGGYVYREFCELFLSLRGMPIAGRWGRGQEEGLVDSALWESPKVRQKHYRYLAGESLNVDFPSGHSLVFFANEAYSIFPDRRVEYYPMEGLTCEYRVYHAARRGEQLELTTDFATLSEWAKGEEGTALWLGGLYFPELGVELLHPAVDTLERLYHLQARMRSHFAGQSVAREEVNRILELRLQSQARAARSYKQADSQATQARQRVVSQWEECLSRACPRGFRTSEEYALLHGWVALDAIERIELLYRTGQVGSRQERTQTQGADYFQRHLDEELFCYVGTLSREMWHLAQRQEEGVQGTPRERIGAVLTDYAKVAHRLHTQDERVTLADLPIVLLYAALATDRWLASRAELDDFVAARPWLMKMIYQEFLRLNMLRIVWLSLSEVSSVELFAAMGDGTGKQWQICFLRTLEQIVTLEGLAPGRVLEVVESMRKELVEKLGKPSGEEPGAASEPSKAEIGETPVSGRSPSAMIFSVIDSVLHKVVEEIVEIVGKPERDRNAFQLAKVGVYRTEWAVRGFRRMAAEAMVDLEADIAETIRHISVRYLAEHRDRVSPVGFIRGLFVCVMERMRYKWREEGIDPYSLSATTVSPLDLELAYGDLETVLRGVELPSADAGQLGSRVLLGLLQYVRNLGGRMGGRRAS